MPPSEFHKWEQTYFLTLIRFSSAPSWSGRITSHSRFTFGATSAGGTAAEVMGILRMYGSVASAIFSPGRCRNAILDMRGCVDRRTLITGRMKYSCLIILGDYIGIKYPDCTYVG